MKRSVPFLFLFALLMLPLAAMAKVEGACTVTIAGVDANTASTPSEAIDVSEDDTLAVEASTEAGKFTGHSVFLEYAGIKWKVDEATDDGKSWSGSVDVSDYAKYGVGLYKVIGESSGIPCSGWAFINVSGNPLGTVAGVAAAGATVVGAGLMGASAARAARRPRKRAESYVAELQLQKPREGELPSTREGVQYYLPGHEPGWKVEEEASTGCFGGMLPAMLQTMAFMVSGAGAPGAPAAPARSRRKGGVLVSVTGVIGALLAGLGTLVLAQQYGLVYPTAIVTLTWLVLWVVADILLTTAMRRSGIRKAYAKIDAAVAALPAEPTTTPAPQPPVAEPQGGSEGDA